MSFSEHRFPTDISYGTSGGPYFETEIIETHSGTEYRNIRTPYGRNKYNVASGIKTKEQLDELIRFFRAVKGRAIGFRFKDWLDYKGRNELLGIGDGENKVFHLIKTYSLGGNQEIRKIKKPVIGSVKILQDNRASIFDIDYKNGIVSFKTPPEKNVKIIASFEFDVLVRFNTDHISASIENYGIHSIENVELIELII